MTIDGKIKYVSLESGFWGITTQDGKKYIPVNLPDQMKEEGLDVLAKVRPAPDQTGNQMWGDYIRILWIARDE